jgi:hypothetical protein
MFCGIYLLGLEEAVNYIIDANLISKGQKNADEMIWSYHIK